MSDSFVARNFTANRPPDRWLSRLAIAIAILSLVAGWAGDLLLAGIVDKSPLGLIALNPRNRNLILATEQLDAIPYYTVGFLRLIFSDPFNYLIGFWFGKRALGWVAKRSKTYGPFVEDGQRIFGKWSYPLVFATPNNIICILAGATGMRIPAFLALNISGTLARLFAVRLLGEAFSRPVNWSVDFITQYRLPIFILSGLALAWTIFGEFRGDNSELKTLRDLDKPDGPSEGASSNE